MIHCGCENSSCAHGDLCPTMTSGTLVVDYVGSVCVECAVQYHNDGVTVYQRDARTGAFLPYGGNK